MKPLIAIVENEVDRHEKAVKAAQQALREAIAHEQHCELRLKTARQAAAEARVTLGRALMAARECWPRSGPNARGWGEFLGRLRIDQDVALDTMKYAGYIDEQFPGGLPDVPGELPTLRDAGLDNRPRLGDAPAEDATEPEIDRDTWCTPRWITTAIGKFDLDPCANERSHVQASTNFRLDFGEDGLVTAGNIDANRRVFVNPPYSDVMPWVLAYGHTRFAFLLKFDPSTKWFAELIKRTELVLIPRGTRIEFEPPPGVPPEKAIAPQFPHALFYARAADATPEIRALCFAWRVERDTAPVNAA